MGTIPLTEAQVKLQYLINEVSQSQDWKGIQETIYLLSIPEVGESIVEGLATPISECSETLEW
ncbi:type II toxin-antitoxin system prevent-host-death family antitoxin [Pseudanabaena sp. BC1403]|uniref:type II toxin-antitoxin system prevent-host-death family antitoxin n=1 Tax=Pseudanabaena sp. BC1403 TaxID=2043171 RepID=UPI000CD80EAF|nr:type II toxin-antitoxin system prevent-host-death family antitoxin [Pseudanabaena sp. BC1403]